MAQSTGLAQSYQVLKLALSGKGKIISLFARPRDPNPHSACRFQRFGHRPSWRFDPKQENRSRRKPMAKLFNLSFSFNRIARIIGRLEFLSYEGFFRLPIDLRSYRLVRTPIPITLSQNTMNAIRNRASPSFTIHAFLHSREESLLDLLFNGKDLSEFKGYKKDKPGNARLLRTEQSNCSRKRESQVAT